MFEQNSNLDPMDIYRILYPAVKRFHILFKNTWNIYKNSHKTNHRKLQNIVIPIMFSYLILKDK